MVTLRADEHRYLVTVAPGGREDAIVRRIPGCRPVTAQQALAIQRQPGSILALDRLFGQDGWQHAADLSIEVSEARQRQHPPAQSPATAALAGNELSVECAFGDKELVKLVPGYRWSAPSRRWFLPASPMALDLLTERFGPLLEVEADAVTFVELKRGDEETMLARASVTPIASPEPEPAAAATQPTVGLEPAADAPPDALLARLDRLAGAVEELVEVLRGSGVAVAAPARAEVLTDMTQAEEVAAAPGPAPVGEWHEWLAQAEDDPAAAVGRISPQLQLASEDALPVLRAVTGIASELAGDFQGALGFLRKSEEHSGAPLPGELQVRARGAYKSAVLGLITTTCGPQRPIASIEALEELMLAELAHDSGFDDTALASRECFDLLGFLMDDGHLRAIEPVLSDYCRVMHLLALARGGRWMAAERVVEMLHNRDLSADGFAFGLIALANTVFEQPCMEEWLMRWPPEASEIGQDDLRWMVGSGLPRLREVPRTIAADAAVALLGLISAAPVEVAQMDERRELVRFIQPGAAARRYAEFLAGFQLAAAGHKKVTQDFPGYLQILAQQPLATSAGHLLTVFVSDSGGAGSTTRRIAEEVFLQSIYARGVSDPGVEVIEFLDMLAESPKGDHLMNELGTAIKEDDFAGAGIFTHEQRRISLERAFAAAQKAGRDVDSVRAFDRLVREYMKHGETEAARTLCLGVPSGFRPLQLPVAQALLTLQLEGGEEFEATADAMLRLSTPDDPKDEATHELKGLALAYPALRAYLDMKDAPFEAPADPQLAGKKLVVVGGHEWLRKLALPKFESWGVKTTWLDPDSAKNGAKALDLASGAADVIIVNTACISHAASGRVTAQAEKSDLKYAFQPSRGVGALLSIARESLLDSEPPIAGRAEPTKHDRRKKLVR